MMPCNPQFYSPHASKNSDVEYVVSFFIDIPQSHAIQLALLSQLTRQINTTGGMGSWDWEGV